MVETIEFNGIKFRRYPKSRIEAHRRYYRPGIADAQRGIQSLHQEIWKQHNGPIPEGCHIHHKDDNVDNNAPDNLVCLTPSEHRHAHAEDHRTPEQLAHLERIRPLASRWHSSEAGVEWHRQHGRSSWVGRKPVEKQCERCGKSYQAMFPERSRFCSAQCQVVGRVRDQKPHRLICSNCGTTFSAGKKSQKTCSHGCSNRQRAAQAKAAGVPYHGKTSVTRARGPYGKASPQA